MEKAKHRKIRGPLIPSSLLDPVSQRTFCTAIFGLLQAWKIYDLILIKSGFAFEASNWWIGFAKPETSFMVKYLVLDGLFLWILPLLRIPRLNYTALATALQIAVISLITIVSTSDWISPVIAVLAGFQGAFHHDKELSFTNEPVGKGGDVWDQTSHFRGRKTIRILPDSTAKLNPFNSNWCLQNGYNSHVKVPVKFNSTSTVDHIELEYTSFDNEFKVLNFTSKQISKLLRGDYEDLQKQEGLLHEGIPDDRISFIELPISQPGYYRLGKVFDSKQKTIKTYKSDLFVPICPSARFSGIDENKDHCVGENIDNLSISVFGVPPFTLVYNEEVNGELTKLPHSVAQPEDFSSPLLKKDYYTGLSANQPKVFAREDLKDISWADTTSIVVPLVSSRLDKPGEFIYTINRVIDGFGNSVDYVPDELSTDIFYKFNVHPVPVASLLDDNLPVISGKTKYLELKLSQVPCPSCEGPYLANVSVTSPDGSTKTWTKKFDYKRPALVPVTEGGVYTLQSMNSKYCPVKIGAASLNVLEAKQPKVSIKAEPVVDKCVGTMGYHFGFEFAGSAPFDIAYKITGLDSKNSHHRLVRTLTSESAVFTYEYRPPSEGSFAVEFLSLKDKYYRDAIKFNAGEHRYETFFKQRPRAFFTKHELALCNGASASVPVSLQGKAPFGIRYEILAPDLSISSFEVHDINTPDYVIETPNFILGGDYTVSIRDANDSSDCDVDFNGQDVVLKVKSFVPTLKFSDGSKAITLTQGNTARIPLSFTSSNLLDVVYKQADLSRENEKLKTIKRFSPADGFPLEESGIYSLVEFTEGDCKGKVLDEAEIVVEYEPKPYASVKTSPSMEKSGKNSYQVTSLCEACSGSFDILLNGKPPFIVEHSVISPSGQIETKTEQVFKYHLTIQLKTGESGVYKYVIGSIADSVYSPDTLKKLSTKRVFQSESIEILNTVSPSPRAAFSKKESSLRSSTQNSQFAKSHAPVYKACLGSLKNQDVLEPIPITLSGKPPFNIKVSVDHEATGTSEILEFSKLESTFVQNYAVYENLKIGTNVLRLVEVSDANGCVQTEFGASDEVVIAVNDVPKIRNIIEDSIAEDQASAGGFPHYCVGDHVTYLLSGIPPFTVYYQFNEVRQKVELESNFFKRRAAQPGDLTILAVGDSSANCLVNFTLPESDPLVLTSRPDLRARIYDIPSVEISHGDYIEEDIHEGEVVEIVFTFTGHPPFTLTYTRTEPISKHHGGDSTKVVETEVVENIYDYEYRIWTRLEGTYEAIELQDSYCIARNHKI
ncbi:unnamed protein product [Kuraishia capsulata CBS 1993]|uniref:Nucleoporin POM152 n=1 Tax=Kuraishia capsulata CBS 1993 TaxID=1382522 RepID=W6MJR5_9ASCO|nr:uncharacterized protein KUCA_T00002478001 [Kuraishia capsulata CBS 1993]CDK26506.1 unnamed protein product [Kuraishia capsulata CBS 1993]